MDNIQVNSTSQARTSANTLSSDAAYYNTLVEELRNVETQIKTNWEGDSNDINDIVTRIESVCGQFDNKVVPALTDLSSAIVTLADDIDATASVSGQVNGQDIAGSAEGIAQPPVEEPGFWSYWGGRIADNFDYTQCEGAVDYVTRTISAVGHSILDVGEAIGDGLTGFVDWLF